MYTVINFIVSGDSRNIDDEVRFLRYVLKEWVVSVNGILLANYFPTITN